MNAVDRELKGPIEDIKLETLIGHFEVLTVPADVPADDFGREVLRMSYVAGFASSIALMKRLDKETPERRAELLEKFEAQALLVATKMDAGDKLPQGLAS